MRTKANPVKRIIPAGRLKFSESFPKINSGNQGNRYLKLRVVDQKSRKLRPAVKKGYRPVLFPNRYYLLSYLVLTFNF